MPKKVHDAFYSGKRSTIVPFAVNDAVEIISGEHSGVTGAVIAIESISPRVQFRIECGMTGSDYIVPIDDVRLLQTEA